MPYCNIPIYCENISHSVGSYLTERIWKIIFDSINGLSHPAIRATRKLVTQRFFWSGLNRDISRWTKSCIKYQKSKVY